MKQYEEPKMEVVTLEDENVITTSDILGNNNNEPGDGGSIDWNEWWKTGGN